MATQLASVDAIEAALVTGDLAKLDPAGRIQFYNKVCESLGLNPLTQPFAYITLNGKLQLYAKKDCTEQLRKIYGVSVTKLEKERIEDVYAVTAYVQDKTGREDSSIGAVSIVYPEKVKDYNGNWQPHPKAGKNMTGDDLANSLMKAETKSKRRATLSICGMGILDETELETIPEVKHFKEVEDPKVVQIHTAPDKPLINRQLEASLKQEEPAPQEAPSAQESVFSVIGDRITCVPVDVVKGQSRTANGQPYVSLKLNGDVEGMASAFCYDSKFHAALIASKGQLLVFTGVIKKNAKGQAFLHVGDVHMVGNQEYADGQPVGEQREAQPIDSVPF
jgi:hypothetical protein